MNKTWWNNWQKREAALTEKMALSNDPVVVRALGDEYTVLLNEYNRMFNLPLEKVFKSTKR